MRRFYLLSLLILTGLAVASILYYVSEWGIARRKVADSIEGIARLKAREIERWREQERIEGIRLSQRPSVMTRIMASIEDPQEENLAWLRDVLTPLVEQKQYNDIVFSDPAGVVRWSLKGSESALLPVPLECISKAMRDGQPLMSDVYTDGSEAGLGLMVATPLYNNRASNSEPVGAVVFHLDVENTLFEMLRDWPIASTRYPESVINCSAQPLARVIAVSSPASQLRFTGDLRNVHLKCCGNSYFSFTSPV